MSNKEQRGKREEGGKQVKQIYAAKEWKKWGEGEELGEKIEWKKKEFCSLDFHKYHSIKHKHTRKMLSFEKNIFFSGKYVVSTVHI